MRSLAYKNTQVLAYVLYLTEGRPKNRALEHWTQAERQLRENIFVDDQIAAEELGQRDLITSRN